MHKVTVTELPVQEPPPSKLEKSAHCAKGQKYWTFVLYVVGAVAFIALRISPCGKTHQTLCSVAHAIASRGVVLKTRTVSMML